MSKIKNDGLDQYGAEHYEQQQLGTAAIEVVNIHKFMDGPPTKVHLVMLVYSVVCSFDLDLDPMTSNLTRLFLRCTRIPKVKFLAQCFEMLEHEQDRQTDRRDRTH